MDDKQIIELLKERVREQAKTLAFMGHSSAGNDAEDFIKGLEEAPQDITF